MERRPKLTSARLLLCGRLHWTDLTDLTDNWCHRRHFTGVRGVRVPPLFGVGVPYPPLFKSCHKKNYDANPSGHDSERMQRHVAIVRSVLFNTRAAVRHDISVVFVYWHAALFVCSKKQMLFVGKSLKLLPPEPFFLVLICTKSLVGWGFAPDPTALPQTP